MGQKKVPKNSFILRGLGFLLQGYGSKRPGTFERQTKTCGQGFFILHSQFPKRNRGRRGETVELEVFGRCFCFFCEVGKGEKSPRSGCLLLVLFLKPLFHPWSVCFCEVGKGVLVLFGLVVFSWLKQVQGLRLCQNYFLLVPRL